MIGWAAAAALGLRARSLRRRLEAVGDAEHELRGALTAFAVVPELASELDRARAALEDLAAARHGRRATGVSEAVPLHALTRSAAAAWQRAGGRRVAVDWRAGPVHVRGDRGRLAQVLGNLLANAVEHGSGPIRVNADRDGDRVRLQVVNGMADRGRGLRIARRAVEESGGTLAVAAVELPLAS